MTDPQMLTPDELRAVLGSLPKTGKLKAPAGFDPSTAIADPQAPEMPEELQVPNPDMENTLASAFSKKLSQQQNLEDNQKAALGGMGVASSLVAPLPTAMVASTAIDPRWSEVGEDAKAGNYPGAVKTGAQAIGKGLLLGQIADKPTTSTLAQTFANALGGTIQGVGQGIHSVGKVVGDTATTVGHGVSGGVKDMFSSPEESSRRQLVEKAMGMKTSHDEQTNNDRLNALADELKQEMASENPDYNKIQALAGQIQNSGHEGSGILDSILGRGKDILGGVGKAFKSGNPLSIVGNTLNAVMGPETDSNGNQTTFTENPDSILGIAKRALGMAPLGAGWDSVSELLGLGNVYPKAQTGNYGSTVPSTAKQTEREDYFNPPSHESPQVFSESINAINNKYNTQMVNIDMAARQALGMARTGPERLALQEKIQALKKSAVDTYNAELAQAKTNKERLNDYGIYVQGTDEKKYIDSLSQGIKNFNAIAGDLDSALTKGDYKTAQSTAEQLVQQMKKVTQQDVPNELKEQMIPLQQKFEGLLGMFKGQVINPRNVPVIWESLHGVHDELNTALDSFLERPGSNVSQETQEFLRGNRIEKSSKKTTYAPAIEAPPAFSHAFDGGKLAVGFTIDGQNVAIDSKGAPHILDKNNKPTDLIAMTDRAGNPSSPAMWQGDRLVHEDGSSVGDDVFSHYNYHQAPINPEKRDDFGFPTVDTKKSVKVSEVSPNNDSFEMYHQKWTNPEFATNNVPYWTSAQSELANRAAGDVAIETGQKASIINEQLKPALDGVKTVGEEAVDALFGGGGKPAKKPAGKDDGVKIKKPKGY